MTGRLFDPDAGERAKAEALARVEVNADEAWLASAREAVLVTARAVEEFTTDRVWWQLDRWGVPPPREPRAMGAVMRGAVAAGVVRGTDRVVKTSRPEAHKRPIPVWRSLVREG